MLEDELVVTVEEADGLVLVEGTKVLLDEAAGLVLEIDIGSEAESLPDDELETELPVEEDPVDGHATFTSKLYVFIYSIPLYVTDVK